MHTVAARPGCKVAMVGIGWANFRPGYMNELGKCCSSSCGGIFQTGKSVWILNKCLLAKDGDLISCTLSTSVRILSHSD